MPRTLTCDHCNKTTPESTAFNWIELDNAGYNAYGYGGESIAGSTFDTERCLMLYLEQREDKGELK